MSVPPEAVAKHMLGLGLGALAHANWHANYMSWENDYWPELSVLQAAHAAEILIKARIAQEHPLLIFEQLPRPTQAGAARLELADLVEHGRTVQYAELPDRLWATTGVDLPNLDRYQSFGRLRNAIQHFDAPSGIDCSDETVNFLYSVLDPFIHECWGLYVVDYNEDYEPYEYLVGGLISGGVRFLVSREAAADLSRVSIEWPNDPSYRREMEARIAAALSGSSNTQPL